MKPTLYLAVAILGISFIAVTPTVSAYEVETLKVQPRNDFILEPSKVEVFLAPGESITRNIYVTSRIDKRTSFKIETEDFVGSSDAKNPATLLGDKKSPYSFKDALLPKVTQFTLDVGQKITIPVKISIPQNAQPGGFYSSLIISNEPDKADSDRNVSGTKTVSRLGALFFIRVKGDVKEEGRLEEIRIAGPSKLFHQGGPFDFKLLFNNTGNVHIVPYGKIEVTNFSGSLMAVVPVEGYFALPNSLRYREITWDSGFLLGRYTATAKINRGYKNSPDVVDTQSVAFWVLPWKLVLAIFVTMAALLYGFLYVKRNFERKKK